MRLTQSLHRNAQQHRDATATVFGDRVRTWEQSRERVSRLAGGLLGLGVRSGDRVGMLSLNSDRFHEYLYATWWAGAVVNPVNIRWSPAEIAYSLTDSGTRVLLVDDAFLPAVPAVRADAPGVTTVVRGDFEHPVPEAFRRVIWRGRAVGSGSHHHLEGIDPE